MTYKTKSLILIIPAILLTIIFVFFTIKHVILINQTQLSTETPMILYTTEQTEKYNYENIESDKIQTIIHIK